MRVSAIEIARRLQDEANRYWEVRLGSLRPTDGFQVELVGAGEEGLLFRSTLYGGRHMFGSARRIRISQIAYIRSKKMKGKR